MRESRHLVYFRFAKFHFLNLGYIFFFVSFRQPLLLLALDEYFTNPSIDPLVRLFDSINSLDLSAMPNFSREEKLILRSFDRPDLFEEKFLSMEIDRDRERGRSRGGSGGSGNGISSIANPNSNLAIDQTLKASEANKMLEASLANETSNEESIDQDEVVKQQNHKRVDSTSGQSINENKDSTISHPPSSSSNNSRIIPRRTSAASLRPSILRKASNASNDQRNNGNGKRPPSPSPSTTLNNARSVSPAHPSFSSSLNQNGNVNGGGIRNGQLIRDTHFYDTQLNYGDRSLSLRVPTSLFSEEVGDVSVILDPHSVSLLKEQLFSL